MQTHSTGNQNPSREPVDALWSPPWWRAEVHGATWKQVGPMVERGWRTQRAIAKSEAVTSRPLQSHDEHVDDVDPADRTYNAQLNLRSSLESTGGDRRDLKPDDEQLPPFRFDGFDVDDETALRYGVAARMQYGAAHPNWHADLETLLRNEWTAIGDKPRRAWQDALPQIRYGYGYQIDGHKKA